MHYDPAFSYEISHIMQNGLERMYGTGGPDGHGEDVIFYLTVYNEPVSMPAEPSDVDVEGILKGIHQVSTAEGEGPRVQLMASGVGYPWIDEAARILAEDWGVQSDLWSVTSWNELARDGAAAEQWNLLNPGEEQRTAYVSDKLAGAHGPVVAVSDYMRAVPLQIARWVPAGLPRARCRRLRLRRHPPGRPPLLPHRRQSVVVQALQALADAGEIAGGEGRRGVRALPDRRPDRDQGHQAGGRRRLSRSPRTTWWVTPPARTSREGGPPAA